MSTLRNLIAKIVNQNPKKSKTTHRKDFEEAKALRVAILEQGEAEFRKGLASDPTPIDENYHAYVQSRITYYTTGYHEGRPSNEALRQMHIHAWAAHYMPVQEFEAFFVQTIDMNQSNAPGAVVDARYAAEQVRSFPRLDAMQAALLTQYEICPSETDAERHEELRAIRADIETKWAADFEQGKQEVAARGAVTYPSDHMSYALFLESEQSSIRAIGTNTIDKVMHEIRIHGWAAHFLEYTSFQKFHARTLIAGDKAAVFAARRALTPTSRRSKYSPFISMLSHCASPRKLEVSREDQLMHAWRKSAPLLTTQNTQQEIETFFTTLNADDLHEMAHGEDVSDAPFLLAIARHPLCDWASAFEILHSFSAASYLEKLSSEEIAANFSADEQTLFHAFATISERAHGAGFKTRKFKHNADWGSPIGRDGSINPYFPTLWQNWALPKAALQPTQGKQCKPRISFGSGEIRPTFQERKKRIGNILLRIRALSFASMFSFSGQP